MDTLNQPQPGSNQKVMLPNATVVLVLGICSIVFACLFVGLVVGIIAIVLSGKPRKMYKESPNSYDGYSQLNAGYIMGIIGTALAGLYVVYWIIWVAILGTAASTFWNMN
jgi:M penetrans paralogue family 26